MDYIPRLYDVPDSERTEEEMATLHQISVDVPRTACSSIVLRSEDIQNVHFRCSDDRSA